MTEAAKNQANSQSEDEATPLTSRQEIEQIKREDLSGQQLRMARRLAQKHGIEATSDLDAVRLLRKNGLDPFANNSKIIPSSNAEAKPAKQTANLPARRKKSELDNNQIGQAQISEKQRANAVMKIQRDLMRRRRKRIIQLITRLAFFVTVPTLLAGYYFFVVATPMYSVKTEFSIQSADNPVLPATSGLFGGGSSIFSPSEAIGVQGYLTSLEAMINLDKDHGFKAIFQDENVDPIQRMDADATNEGAFKTYKKKVLVGFDPTEGIVRMEVIAPNPDKALEFASALIEYAENRIDDQTERLRGDQENAARQLYVEAESRMVKAQQKVLALQEQRGVLSTEMEITVQMQQIATLEGALQTRKLALAELENNIRPNKAKVNALTNQINELEKSIAELRDGMTAGSEKSSSLAKITSELDQAKGEVLLRQTLLAQSVQTMEAASIEASRQTKYLALNVNPIKPEQAAYPRKFENTFLSFLVFAGLYLIISLTGSILREQVSN